MELTIKDALLKGIEAHKSGKIKEADQLYTAILKVQPNNPDANHNLGVLAVGLGKINESLTFFKTALEVNPSVNQFWISYIDALIKLEKIEEANEILRKAYDKEQQVMILDKFEEVYNNMGVILKNKGYFEEAIGSFSQALKIKPDYAEAYYNLGTVQMEKSDTEAAIKSFKRALKIKPNTPEVYINLGAVHYIKGELDAAVENYKQALKINPFSAEAYNNMGNVQMDKGELDAAIESFKQALKIKPDYAVSYYNLGNVQSEKGDPEAAIESYKQALNINPDSPKVYFNLGNILKNLSFTKPSSDMQDIILSLLEKKTFVRPKDISQAAISLLKFEPVMEKLCKLKIQGGQDHTLQQTISSLSELPLLLKLMCICSLNDLDLEAILTDVRSGLLLSILEIDVTPKILCFQSALALQCFTNEYIYSQTDNEFESIKLLEDLIEKQLAKGLQPSAKVILCIASYKALNEYNWYSQLTITNEIKEVFIRQVSEPQQEKRLKLNIPILKEITDKVSSKVREQYESNPYPRWVNLKLPLNPSSISKVVNEIKLKLYHPEIMKIEKPNILIAGCGTGQHSIGTAARFKNSRVLAVDLSLSSLAYAKRKTEELGIKNIEYMQADILDLGEFNNQFDIVESAGVIHHMENPIKGWRVLVDCIKPGGLMMLGLYSELARQHIVNMREDISNLGIGPSDAEMKLFRSNLIDLDSEDLKVIKFSPDFFNLSEWRDLLFHVQEHRFTLLQISKYLEELGLYFCGFEPDKSIEYKFKLNNTHVNDLYNLEKWNLFELSNKHTFLGMYQFWCQKIIK